jgi:hypothetical protein
LPGQPTGDPHQQELQKSGRSSHQDQCGLLVLTTSTGTAQRRASRKPGGFLEHYGIEHACAVPRTITTAALGRCRFCSGIDSRNSN